MNIRVFTAALFAATLSACAPMLMDTSWMPADLDAAILSTAQKCTEASSWDACFKEKLPQLETNTYRESCYVKVLLTTSPLQYRLTVMQQPAFDACVAEHTSALAARKSTETADAPSAGPAAGSDAFHALESGAAAAKCPRVGPADRLLEKLDGGALMPTIADNLARTDGWSAADVQRFLVLTAWYAESCSQDKANAELLREHVAAGTIAEADVERAVKRKECGYLKQLAGHDLWPFARTFASEVEGGQYEQAEITRALWIETLEKFSTDCTDRLSSRERIAVTTKIRRLHRIIGLDDPTLITMRSKMIEALKAGASDKVLAYSKAISEREQALDGANAAEYRAKLAAIEGTLAEQKKAAAATAQPDKPDATGTAASKSKNVAETAANVAATAKSVAATVETTQQILSIFGI